MAGKDFGGLDFSEIFKDLNKLADQVTKNAEGIEQAAGDAGKQVGDSFVDGIEQGFEDAASRIAASSLKINKAFKDLAKRLTNQKDIFNISIGGKNVALDIDFSDVNIDSADFQKQINQAFEKFKIDNAIEFDSKTVEKQFKDILGLHIKYTDKLSKLQNQSTKLTKPDTVKTNAQEQLAMIDGLKEIQRVLDKTSGTSISLPHVYSSSTKDLQTIIETIDRVQKGEEKVGKQRDTNVAKIKKENQELKERNKILEEKVGPVDEVEVPPARKPRAKKSKQSVDVEVKTIEETSAIKAKSDEQAVVAEQTQLNLAEEELKVEKEITEEKKKQIPKGVSGAQQEIKSQEELQKKIEDTNRVIKIQKEWLEYIDPVLDDETYKTSGKKEAADELKFRTNNLKDFRLHPEEYEWQQMYQEKVEIAQAKAYKEAERQGVAQSRLDKYRTDSIYSYDINVKKLQEERALHEKILTDAEKKLEVLQQQLQVETQKVKIEAKTLETHETDSGQMSMLPAVEEEIKAKDNLAKTNEKVAKSEKKVKEASQGTQMTMDDIIPASAEDSAPKVESEEKALNKVGAAAEKAAGKKKKFAKANKEVAASVTPSVKGLKTEADAMEDIGDAAKNTTKVVSEEAKRAAENMSFSTRDYEKLYTEMESFAEQRKAENGYDLSRVSVNTDSHGNPLGATISYYKKATKETITETFKIDKAAQEAEDGVERLVLSSRKATAGIADLEKAELGAINKQDQLIAQKNKTVSSMAAVLDPNANRTLFGTKYADEATNKIQAIRDEVAKLDQVIDGKRVILSEEELIATKRRIAELTQEARDFINQSKNAEYAPTQLESHSVSSGNKYRQDQLSAKINEWKRAGIYVGDLKAKAEELAQSVTKITKHEELRKYLEGLKEARALATLATQDKKAEEERQKSLNEEYKEYISLIEKRDAIEAQMIGLDPEKNRDELAALRSEYDAIDNEWNGKYGNFLEREDVQNHFSIDELSYADDAARRKMAVKQGKISDKKRLEEEAAAQKKINEAYAEYIRLVQERGRESVKLAGLDPEKNKAEIDAITAHIDGIDDKLNETYGGLLSNHIAQATLTLEDFMKYYDKWQQKLAEKEAKVADKARQKEEKPYRDYGKTTANSAVRKRDRLQGEIDALGVTNPEILAKIDNYNAKVQKVLDLRAQFNSDPNAAKDPEIVKQFQKTSVEADRVYKSIKAVIDEEQKMIQMSSEQGFEPIELSSSQISNLKNEMIAHAQATAQGRVELKGWDGDNKKLYYTVTDSKGAVQEMTLALGQGSNTMYQLRTATKETGTLIQQVFKGIKTKAKELLSFVIGGGSVYKVIELLRQGIQYVREIDLALTELKKVTDETEESYDKFLETAAKTADKVGSTIQKVVSSTADWARLGYSMEQAAKFAESTQILMNVSEFTDVSQATDTLISSVQAFGYTAETSMEVVDLLNTIGNNYAISTADLAQSLTKSSASLVAAGGDLAEAAALTATANAIIQDADAVGTALKTTSLRLRGTDVKVLEEEGVDSDGAVTSKSKLQSKVKALSGVDILTETGDYKSTYEILSQIADVWEDISNMDQAALLELLAGKRNASVLAAILQSPEQLKEAYEDANDAAGSAWEENEKYLDSIQGKIDQFNNAMQTLWSNLLDDDIVKNLVEWVTKIVKSLDTTQGKVLAVVKAVALLMAYKKVNPLDWIAKFGDISNTIKTDGLKSYITSLFQVSAAQKTVTADTLVGTIAQQQNDVATQQQIISKMGLTNVTGALTAAQKLQAAQELVTLFNGDLITEDLAKRMAAMLGYQFSVDATNGATVALDTTTKSFMASNPIGWILLIVSALISVVMWLSNTKSSIEKLEDKLSDLNSEVSDIKSELDSLNSELETTQDRMEELLSMNHLSFTEEEELKNLKLQNAELERRIRLEEMMLKSKEEEAKNAAKEVIKKKWDSGGVDKNYYMDYRGEIHEDKWNETGQNTKDLLNKAIAGYDVSRDAYIRYQTILSQWDDKDEEKNKELLKKYGDSYWSIDTNGTKYYKNLVEKTLLPNVKSIMDGQARGINLILGDMSDIISQNGLSYSMGDEDINKFLDEYYAYNVKWSNAQGTASKSSVISAIWDNTESEAMAELKEELDEIAKSDSADKQVKAQKLIQDALDDTTGQYERLKTFMGTVGVTAEEMAKFFVSASEAPDISTPEGITEVYQDGINILGKYKDARDEVLGQDENGEDITWDNLFTIDEDGNKVADRLKIASILEGSDEAMREEFAKMVEAVENGEMDVNEALANWNISGFDKVLDNLNDEFEGLNNEIFPNIADDINGLIDTVGELKSALEDVASTIDLLSAAEEQMANSGQISVKTALDLMAVTDDYNKVVTVENGVLKLAKGAQDHLTQAKFNSIKVQLEAAATLAENTYQTALASNEELDYADNANVVMTAESIKAEAIGRVSAVIVALGAAMDKIQKKEFGSVFSAFGETYTSATATVVAQSNAMKTSIAELERDAKNKRALADVYSFADDYESFKDNYDFDKTPGDKYDDDSGDEDDAFQRAMDYWENRIAANQARYEQLQNEIDLLESKSQKADASYYEEQIKLENERLSLLQQQKAEAQRFLGTFTEGSEEWWEVANTLNDIEGELDSVTQSIVDLQDAIGEIDTYKFEEFGTRLDNLISKLGTIRDLIAPDGEENWFDDDGNWTEEGVAVLGSYVQELEFYKQGLEETRAELNKYNKAYSNNTKAYYESLGIHSEQEYYEKVEELTEQQYDFAESISDTEQSIVDMYESNIDAVEEYINTLIDGYNDYIDSVKEALSAERDCTL